MLHFFRLRVRLLLLLLSAPVARLYAAPALPAVFTDHLVLQRDAAVPIWGTATPGAEITVEFAGQRKTATANKEGRWRLQLDPLKASAEGRVLKVTEGGVALERGDVLVGEVWLCSGQSNMGMPVQESANAAAEIAAAEHPRLRLFTVARHPSLDPLEEVAGQWAPCTPETVAGFSATAYYFGRRLQAELGVPIGLIHSSFGGSPAEAWTRLEVLQSIPTLGARAETERAQMAAQPEAARRFPLRRRAWEEKYGVTPPPPSVAAKGWAEPALDTIDWKKVTLPAQWGQLGYPTGGVFWVRKEIELPESAAGKTFVLKLLWMIEQYDTAYWNGVELGHTGDEPPDFYMWQRDYPVLGPLVKAGRNVIAIRIVSASAQSGLWQWGRQLEVPVPDPQAVNDEWLLKQESAFAPGTAEALAARPKPNNIPFREVSSSLYNGMIAPLAGYGMRGAIWYQGKNNGGRPEEYRELLTRMIQDWRAQWGQGDFPFIIQQLVNNGRAAKGREPACKGGVSPRSAEAGRGHGAGLRPCHGHRTRRLAHHSPEEQARSRRTPRARRPGKGLRPKNRVQRPAFRSRSDRRFRHPREVHARRWFERPGPRSAAFCNCRGEQAVRLGRGESRRQHGGRFQPGGHQTGRRPLRLGREPGRCQSL